MSYSDILFEVNDGVAVITLNRPEMMNAFSGKMGEEWSDAYRRCDRDDNVRVVVVTGAGKAFCAGADMSMGAATFDTYQGEMTASPVTPAWEVRKPIIAALNGHAIGLGFSLAIQADLRVIAEEGKYGLLQVRRGVIADAFVHWTLPRLIGTERASELLLTGRRISGKEAYDMGIAARCLPAAQVLPAALEWARDIATHTGPLAVGITKKLLWSCATLNREQVARWETDLLCHTMGRPDAIEGGLAYAEKRVPRWQSSVNNDWPAWPEE